VPSRLARPIFPLYAGFKPPYILVGHSIGGLIAPVYAERHPGEVARLLSGSTIRRTRQLRQIPQENPAVPTRGQRPAIRAEARLSPDSLRGDQRLTDCPSRHVDQVDPGLLQSSRHRTFTK
jgi:pimeloyl-ACP methyl ester carboxylesterase